MKEKNILEPVVGETFKNWISRLGTDFKDAIVFDNIVYIELTKEELEKIIAEENFVPFLKNVRVELNPSHLQMNKKSYIVQIEVDPMSLIVGGKGQNAYWEYRTGNLPLENIINIWEFQNGEYSLIPNNQVLDIIKPEIIFQKQ